MAASTPCARRARGRPSSWWPSWTLSSTRTRGSASVTPPCSPPSWLGCRPSGAGGGRCRIRTTRQRECPRKGTKSPAVPTPSSFRRSTKARAPGPRPSATEEPWQRPFGEGKRLRALVMGAPSAVSNPENTRWVQGWSPARGLLLVREEGAHSPVGRRNHVPRCRFPRGPCLRSEQPCHAADCELWRHIVLARLHHPTTYSRANPDANADAHSDTRSHPNAHPHAHARGDARSRHHQHPG